jgi:hypothetical protein
MIAFRVVFLVVVLAGAIAITIARAVPQVALDSSEHALASGARMASLLVAETWERSRAEREAVGSAVAGDELLRASLSSSTDTIVDEEAPEPVAMFRQALNARSASRSAIDAALLVDADGELVDARNDTGAVNIPTLLSRSGAAEALESGEPSSMLFSVDGAIFASTATPVTSGSDVVAAVVLVERLDSAWVASTSWGADAQIAYFLGLDVVATNIGDQALLDAVRDTVRGTPRDAIGSPGRLLTRARHVVDDRVALIAPIRLGTGSDADPSLGAIVVTQAAAVPDNPITLLAAADYFDDGLGRLAVPIGIALVFYFLALLFLEAALGRAGGRLARSIEDNATANNPERVDVSASPAWLRPVARAYNVFLDAYRAHAPQARRTRAELSGSGLARRSDAEPDSSSGVLPRFEERVPVAPEPVDLFSALDSKATASDEARPGRVERPAVTGGSSLSELLSSLGAAPVSAPLPPRADEPEPEVGADEASAHVSEPEAATAEASTPSTDGAGDSEVEQSSGPEASVLGNPDAESEQGAMATPEVPPQPFTPPPSEPMEDVPTEASRRPSVSPPPVPGSAADDTGEQSPFAEPTVPRVSMEDLARRAAAARSGGGPEHAPEPDALLRAAEERLQRLRSGSSSESFRSEHRELYEQFVDAKELCGEDTSRLTYERFVEKLTRNRTALIERYNCSDVRFDVAMQEGKVTLKATPIR